MFVQTEANRCVNILLIQVIVTPKICCPLLARPLLVIMLIDMRIRGEVTLLPLKYIKFKH